MQASALVRAEHHTGEPHRITLSAFQAQLARIGTTPFAYRADWWLTEAMLREAEQPGSGAAQRSAASAEILRVYGSSHHWLPALWLANAKADKPSVATP